MSNESDSGARPNLMELWRDRGNWDGSGYELGMQFVGEPLNTSLRSALFQTLWRASEVVGVVDDQRKLGQGWEDLAHVSTESGAHYYGYLTLSEDRLVGCGSCFIDGSHATWLVAYIPTYMLQRAPAIDHPVGAHAVPRRREVDDVLVSIGRHVYQRFHFVLGVIGEEASSFWPLEQLASLHLRKPPVCCLVPETTKNKLGMDHYAIKYPEGLYRLNPEYDEP